MGAKADGSSRQIIAVQRSRPLNRYKMFARAALSARSGVISRPLTRRMGNVAECSPPTMSDLPVPSGSWSEAYSKKQTKNNLHLLFGVAFSAVTLVVAKNSGLVELGLGPKIGK